VLFKGIIWYGLIQIRIKNILKILVCALKYDYKSAFRKKNSYKKYQERVFNAA